MSDKKSADKGKPERKPAGTRPGSRTDDLAFEHIIEAILGADPEAISDHRHVRRRRKLEKRPKKV